MYLGGILMALKHVHHVVNRPGRKKGLNEVTIQVADKLATVPGIPQRKEDVDFYSRNCKNPHPVSSGEYQEQ